MDLLGTCYDLLHKPYPIYQRHVDMFRHKVIMGTYKGTVSDAVLTDTMKDGKKTIGKNASANLQQSTVEEGVELNEESKIV